MTSIVVSARPQPFSFESARTALLVVDMQNDFASEGGMFAGSGGNIATNRAIMPAIAATLEAVRNSRIPVVYIKMGYAPDLSDAGGPEAPNRIKHRRMRVGEESASGKGRILVRGDWGTEIVDELAPTPGETEIWKTRYSGFFGTTLDQHLQQIGVDSLIVTGCTTSVCVDSTVRDAMFRDYRCLILEDCVAEPIARNASRTNHEASLLTFELLLGWVGNSRELVAALEA
jgi:ureidoacrylate peracid hydrolase